MLYVSLLTVPAVYPASASWLLGSETALTGSVCFTTQTYHHTTTSTTTTTTTQLLHCESKSLPPSFCHKFIKYSPIFKRIWQSCDETCWHSFFCSWSTVYQQLWDNINWFNLVIRHHDWQHLSGHLSKTRPRPRLLFQWSWESAHSSDVTWSDQQREKNSIQQLICTMYQVSEMCSDRYLLHFSIGSDDLRVDLQCLLLLTSLWRLISWLLLLLLRWAHYSPSWLCYLTSTYLLTKCK